MNKYIKSLISFLILQPRTLENNVFIGYINSLNSNNKIYSNWSDLLQDLISFDLSILDLIEKDLNTNKLIAYASILNKSYNFINDEFEFSFANTGAFNIERLASIKDYNKFMLARRTRINEYEKNKGVGV